MFPRRNVLALVSPFVGRDLILPSHNQRQGVSFWGHLHVTPTSHSGNSCQDSRHTGCTTPRILSVFKTAWPGVLAGWTDCHNGLRCPRHSCRPGREVLAKPANACLHHSSVEKDHTEGTYNSRQEGLDAARILPWM